MLREKFNSLAQKIKNSENPFAVDDIAAVEDYIKDCNHYAKTVADMEGALTVARYRLEGEEYREYIANLDRNRKIAHDALIASTKLLNKLCKIYGEPAIYTGGESRIEIAKFAVAVTNELIATRVL